MILGIGTDLVDIRRIERALERFGDRFLNRVFTEGERQKAQLRAGALAKRFAAKEACFKALEARNGHAMRWHDVEVRNLPSGKPVLHLSGSAAEALHALIPAEKTAHIHVSLADEYPHAQAFVIISAE